MKGSNMNIGTRLGTAFAVVVVLMLFVGLFALLEMTRLERQITSLVDDKYPKTVLLNDIKSQVNIVARAIRNIQIIGSGEEADKEKQRISEARVTISGNLEKLSRMVTDSQGRKLLKDMVDSRDEYAKELESVIALINSGNKDSARQQMLTTLRKAQSAYLNSIDAILAFQGREVALEGNLAHQTAIRSRIIISIILLCSTVAAIALALYIVRGLTQPLSELVNTNNRLADGDLTVRTTVSGKDEVGQLADSSRRMIAHLQATINGVTDTANQIAAASIELQATAERIATGAEEVAAQTGTVATASEEMAATSNDIAHNCSLAAEGSRQTSESAASGSAVIQETISGMNRIADQVRHSARTVEQLGVRSEQIGAIIGTIEDIADQTNLLALNAAIEAARAGEQGRGFAVVADEVRALAERTTKATHEISGMIKAIQDETRIAVIAMSEGVQEVDKGAETSRKSAQALEIVLRRIGDMSQQISQIATAAEEQTATTSEISTNIHQITDVVNSTAKGASDTATSASRLALSAQTLQDMVGKFKLT